MKPIETTLIPLARLERNTGQIDGLPENPRQITESDFKRLLTSIKTNPEMLNIRELVVFQIPGTEKYAVIGGNMRLEALQTLSKDKTLTKEERDAYSLAPCKIIPPETTIEKLKAFTLLDNSSFGEWDLDLLANWDVDLIDACCIEIPPMPEQEEEEKCEEDDFDETRDEIEARCQKGDIWQLGRHRLMCGDSTEVESYYRLMQGDKAVLCFTDPPYGMKKEKDGVMNDNLNFADLLEFNKLWIPLTFANLTDNGSWYCWGIDEPLMDIYAFILKPMQKKNEITFRNLLTWDKGVGQGQMSEEYRMYALADEKCLFVMMGQQMYGRDKSTWFEGFEKFRMLFKDELKKAGLTNGQAIKLTGNSYLSHCTSQSQYGFPTKDIWNKMFEISNGKAFKQDYEKVKQDYEKVKQEWYATRAYFNNTHDNMNNVWHFDRTSKEERTSTGGHATPKPLALCARGIKTSSREEDIVLDVFGGSGSTLIACEQLGRKCRMMELDPHYCDVILARWEKFTGLKAERITNINETA